MAIIMFLLILARKRTERPSNLSISFLLGPQTPNGHSYQGIPGVPGLGTKTLIAGRAGNELVRTLTVSAHSLWDL